MNREYHYIKDFKSKSISAPFLVIDLETTGLNPRKDSIVGIAFTTQENKGYYTTDIENFMQAVFHSSCALIFHNAVFDCSMLVAKGYASPLQNKKIHDTMLLAHTLDPDRPSLKLKTLAEDTLDQKP